MCIFYNNLLPYLKTTRKQFYKIDDMPLENFNDAEKLKKNKPSTKNK